MEQAVDIYIKVLRLKPKQVHSFRSARYFLGHGLGCRSVAPWPCLEHSFYSLVKSCVGILHHCGHMHASLYLLLESIWPNISD